MRVRKRNGFGILGVYSTPSYVLSVVSRQQSAQTLRPPMCVQVRGACRKLKFTIQPLVTSDMSCTFGKPPRIKQSYLGRRTPTSPAEAQWHTSSGEARVNPFLRYQQRTVTPDRYNKLSRISPTVASPIPNVCGIIQISQVIDTLHSSCTTHKDNTVPPKQQSSRTRKRCTPSHFLVPQSIFLLLSALQFETINKINHAVTSGSLIYLPHKNWNTIMMFVFSVSLWFKSSFFLSSSDSPQLTTHLV